MEFATKDNALQLERVVNTFLDEEEQREEPQALQGNQQSLISKQMTFKCPFKYPFYGTVTALKKSVQIIQLHKPLLMCVYPPLKGSQKYQRFLFATFKLCVNKVMSYKLSRTQFLLFNTMLTKCVASSLLSCEAVVGFSYPSGYLVLWLCHGFLHIAAHCIAGSLSGVPCSKRFQMSWEEHAEYVCIFKNGVDGAQVFLCSAFAAVIGFPSGHSWSCLWGLQLFFRLPNLGLSFAFSHSGRCAVLSRWRSFFSLSLLLWERAQATMLGRGQRTAWQSCPLLPPLRSFWGSNLGHQVCTASES